MTDPIALLSTRRILAVIAALACVAAMSASPAAMADDPAAPIVARVTEQLAAAYPNTPFRDVKPSPLPGIYEVTMGDNVAYTDGTGRYFLFGHLFDMQKQVDLTQQHVDQGYKTRFPAALLDQAIKTVHGNGRRVVAIFSDPDCPYCHQLEEQLALVDNVTIYTFLYPLESIHPEAMTKAIRIQCAPDPARAWHDWMTQRVLPPLVACKHPINDNLVLGSRLGVTGTPTLIAQDGRMLPGAVSATQLNAWLDAGQPDAAAAPAAPAAVAASSAQAAKGAAQ